MTKKEKKAWLKAIKKLRKHYENYPLNEFPLFYDRVMEKRCPLCLACASFCDDCLWVKFEGKHCIDSPSFNNHTTKLRLDRLDRWEKKITEEE